jgi:serine/threonine protein kinase
LNAQNIFIVRKSPEWWIKIGDFGITKRSSNVTALQTQIGTPLYRAPEVSGYIKGAAEDSESGTYTNAVDIWSFGCVVYEMLALQVPFANSAIVVDFCNGGAFPAAPLTLRASNQGLDFVKRILISHPQRRRKASEIEKDPWFCGAALQKAMTALNLRNDKHSNPHFSDIGVEAGADIVHTAAFQRTLAAGMAAGMTAAAGVAVAAANLYNGKRSNGQFSKIGVEGDTDVVLGHPSLENGELLESSVVDKIKPDNYSISRTGLSYIYGTTASCFWLKLSLLRVSRTYS